MGGKGGNGVPEPDHAPEPAQVAQVPVKLLGVERKAPEGIGFRRRILDTVIEKDPDARPEQALVDRPHEQEATRTVNEPSEE